MNKQSKISKALSLRPLILIVTSGIILVVAQILFVLNFCIPGVRYDSFIHIVLISIYLIFWIYTFFYIKSAKDNLDTEANRHLETVIKNHKEISEYENEVNDKIRRFRSMITSSHAFYIRVNDMTYDEWCAMLEQKVIALDLDTRIKNCLVRSNIWTIRQLVSLTTEELVKKTSLGEISLNKLRVALRKKCRYLHLELLYIASPDEQIEAELLPLPWVDEDDNISSNESDE